MHAHTASSKTKELPKIGDVVQLKGDESNPVMVVSCAEDVEEINCFWFDESNELNDANFHFDMLDLID